jgi:hypothetical protein
VLQAIEDTLVNSDGRHCVTDDARHSLLPAMEDVLCYRWWKTLCVTADGGHSLLLVMEDTLCYGWWKAPLVTCFNSMLVVMEDPLCHR